MRLRWILFGLAIGLPALPARANAIADLQSFVATVQSGRAGFEQTVFDAKGKLSQKSVGTLVFTRPGKFRWGSSPSWPALSPGCGGCSKAS